MKKLILTALLLTILIMSLTSQKTLANSINRTISQSGINKGAIAVSVKEVKTGKTIYSLNADKPSVPASSLKLITLSAALDTLGSDYEFLTELYKNNNNELFLKLGADPFLTSSDLNKLFEHAKNKKIIEPKKIYMDDYIFDSMEWGEGWQWDDDLNPLMPKFSSYNIDKNLLNIVVAPTTPNAPANIYTTKFYPTTFMNLVTTGNENKIVFKRNNNISPDIITVEGTINKQITRQIPINYLKRYFILRTEDAIRNAKIEYYGKFLQKKTPSAGVYKVAEIKHPISSAVTEILKNSNNMAAESVFKAAGAKFANNTGSFENSQKMLNSYFDKIGLNHDDIRIVDGSGVSKNNMITADFMTEFLLKTPSEFKNLLPTPGEGTLTSRMLYFKDNLYAKTGTHCSESALAGFITSRSGKTYVFDIMINDPKSKNQDKKSLEEYILRDIYANY